MVVVSSKSSSASVMVCTVCSGETFEEAPYLYPIPFVVMSFCRRREFQLWRQISAKAPYPTPLHALIEKKINI